jgi:hypothetical protein
MFGWARERSVGPGNWMHFAFVAPQHLQAGQKRKLATTSRALGTHVQMLEMLRFFGAGASWVSGSSRARFRLARGRQGSGASESRSSGLPLVCPRAPPFIAGTDAGTGTGTDELGPATGVVTDIDEEVAPGVAVIAGGVGGGAADSVWDETPAERAVADILQVDGESEEAIRYLHQDMREMSSCEAAFGSLDVQAVEEIVMPPLVGCHPAQWVEIDGANSEVGFRSIRCRVGRLGAGSIAHRGKGVRHRQVEGWRVHGVGIYRYARLLSLFLSSRPLRDALW